MGQLTQCFCFLDDKTRKNIILRVAIRPSDAFTGKQIPRRKLADEEYLSKTSISESSYGFITIPKHESNTYKIQMKFRSEKWRYIDTKKQEKIECKANDCSSRQDSAYRRVCVDTVCVWRKIRSLTPYKWSRRPCMQFPEKDSCRQATRLSRLPAISSHQKSSLQSLKVCLSSTIYSSGRFLTA